MLAMSFRNILCEQYKIMQKNTYPNTHKLMDVPPSMNDHQRAEDAGLTAVIGWVLQVGVIISSVIIVLGMGLYFLHPAGRQQTTLMPHTLAQVFQGVLLLQPAAIIALGLIILIATPVVRVAISILAFAFEHDRKFTVISTIVLLILLLSFLLGKGGA